MKTKKYSLHATTSTIFISLVIIFGSILSWQNYSKTSEVLVASGNYVFEQLNRELALEFGSMRKSVKQVVNFVAYSPISQSSSLAPRLQSLQLLAIALADVPEISTIQVGYPNGDVFLIRPTNTDAVRKIFSAPSEASFVVDNIARNAKGEQLLQRIFYDASLQELNRLAATPTDYTLAERPWYQLALANEQPVITDPYIFYFYQKLGITLTGKNKHNNVVVAVDITLDQLTQTLNRNSLTANTELVVFGKSGDALIYNKASVLQMTDDHFKVATLAELGSEILTFISQDLQLETQVLNFNYNGQEWLGAVQEMHIPGGNSLFVLMVSPEQELLSKAVQARNLSLLITAAIVLIMIPIVWLFARKIAKPLRRLATEAHLISQFDFSSAVKTQSVITEVDELAESMRMMKTTISQFLSLINSLAGEKDFDVLLQRITQKTREISQADAALTYLYNEQDNTLEPGFFYIGAEGSSQIDGLPNLSLNDNNELIAAFQSTDSSMLTLHANQSKTSQYLLTKLATTAANMVILPLHNRQEEAIGILCLMYKDTASNEHISFVQALSGFAAVSLESRQLIMMQKALLESFIKLIAGAIDSKSPYTGGHCARVPELAKSLAEAACASDTAPFQDFQLNDDQWEALHIASWLHDCGKVTTPEYVVDKATKLETIYDRIHEIRMRVEVLKRDAEITYWQQIAQGGDIETLEPLLQRHLRQLDEDFAFIAECNAGGEFMAQEKITRLQRIAEYTWLRTLDDSIGISWEEGQRKQQQSKPVLPVQEKLLADKPEHIIARDAGEQMPANNPWGFQLDVPEHKYNRGELYNLTVERGTLTTEERFKINDHIVQTIIMLEKLPYPAHLKDVPVIAGSHHEKIDGTGYPKGLKGEDVPLTGKMMALADIFEALTASDRPYKKAKTLSESLRIMSFMVKDRHIDTDLFHLFLSSGVYLQYAEKFLQAEQIDAVDIKQFFS
ncbi:MAG: HAMP domain-containing protein [Methyloprofundus sp.]|nr:HAMP domain-containing protein [Methyloprofundus sp.]